MKETQFRNILAALKTGEKITALDALNRWGCFQLPARIFDMKRAGYRIITRMVKTRNGKRIARYEMPKTEGGET